MVHLLKIWPEFFELVFRGVKTFEVRKNDRGFGVADTLVLREWNPVTEEYTGRACVKSVVHVMEGGTFGLKVGYVAMSIEDKS